MRISYKRLMKDLPLEKCPPGLTGSIVVKSQISMKQHSSRDGHAKVRLINWVYSLACLAVMLLICTVFPSGPYDREAQHQRLAINTTSLTQQISCTIKNSFLIERGFIR